MTALFLHVNVRAAGVEFRMPPTATESALVAVFDDTCGNLIGLTQVAPDSQEDGSSSLRDA